MNISEIFNTKKAVFSFEVFPPRRDYPIDTIYKTLDKMTESVAIKPDFISVTYGAGGNVSDIRTADISKNIKKNYNIEPLSHITCVNSTKSEILSVLDILKENEIENILALSGDVNPQISPKNEFEYASDLIKFVKDKDYDLNIAAACYPETHPDSPNLEMDIKYTKLKVENGATHLISQLFFDNNDFYNFMYQMKNLGVNVPVQAGIMPVINKNSIKRIVTLCGASLPKKFLKILNKYEDNEEALFDAAIAYATDQIIDLLSNNVSGIHLYTMNNPEVAIRITKNIASIIGHINSGE